MKRLSTCLALLALALAAPTANSTDVRAGISLSNDGVNGFYLTIGETYQVPQKEIVVIRDRHIPDEHLSVVFFIAGRAKVAPGLVVDYRLANHTWLEVARHFGLGPESFYVEFATEPGPPYGRAFGYYKNRPRAEWHRIVLADDDIVNLVNLRLLTSRYHCLPDEVVSLRGGKKGFVAIHSEIERKHGHAKEVASAKPAKASKGKKHGKD